MNIFEILRELGRHIGTEIVSKAKDEYFYLGFVLGLNVAEARCQNKVTAAWQVSRITFLQNFGPSKVHRAEERNGLLLITLLFLHPPDGILFTKPTYVCGADSYLTVTANNPHFKEFAKLQVGDEINLTIREDINVGNAPETAGDYFRLKQLN